MDEYISKHDVLVALMDNDLDHIQAPNGKEAVQILSDIPAADVAPVVHGKWRKAGTKWCIFRCNRCGNLLDFDGVNAGMGDANFCPNCGAKMDGGKNT